MDITAAYEFCRRASEMAYPRLLVAPPMPWGVSFHHMNFPGTITLSTETFIQVLVEVVASLHAHGFERFLIVNGHGGNIPADGRRDRADPGGGQPGLHRRLLATSPSPTTGSNEKHGITGITGHACEMETSVAHGH